MAKVNGNRHATSVIESVYTYPHAHIANPEISKSPISGEWELFFNTLGPNLSGFPEYMTIVKVTGSTNSSFSTPEQIFSGQGQPICSKTAPGFYNLNLDQYGLFYGVVSRNANGVCDLTEHSDIGGSIYLRQ